MRRHSFPLKLIVEISGKFVYLVSYFTSKHV